MLIFTKRYLIPRSATFFCASADFCSQIRTRCDFFRTRRAFVQRGFGAVRADYCPNPRRKFLHQPRFARGLGQPHECCEVVRCQEIQLKNQTFILSCCHQYIESVAQNLCFVYFVMLTSSFFSKQNNTEEVIVLHVNERRRLPAGRTFCRPGVVFCRIEIDKLALPDKNPPYPGKKE